MRPVNALRALVLVALLLPTRAAPGMGRDPLKIGDPAPALDVEAWIDGEAVTIETGTVYVIMFWDSVTSSGRTDSATAKSISRMRKLHELYGGRGLVVVVISPDDAERLKTVVGSQRSGKGFHLAADRRSATHRAWVRKAGIEKLPVGFIVGKSKIMYIGRPRDADFINILIQVMTGRYDPQLQEEAQPKLDSARRARKVKNWRMAKKWYDEVIALDPRVFAPIAMERFQMLLMDMRDRDAAYEYVRDAIIGRMYADDAGALRMLAVLITESPQLSAAQRDLDVAIDAALLSLELDGRRSPDALSCVAGVHFHRGEYDDAIGLQTQAYFNAMPSEKAAHMGLLRGYQESAARSGAMSGPR
ncbi:MAG: redoxin domain-containing protein [Planctomycetes bacterium]|nr:redoxin domain-containing protein [Planctomycetota bacterium]